MRLAPIIRKPLLTGLLTLAAGSSLASAPNAPDTPEYATRLHAARTAYFKVVAGGGAAADDEAHTAIAALEEAFPGDPKGLAYRGSLQLLDCAHSWQIWNIHKQAAEGLNLLDAAVNQAPDEPEIRFLRAATDWHLPSFYHRRDQAESDFAILAPHAEEDAKRGILPPELAAASLGFWGQILSSRGDTPGARSAYESAIRIAPQSPAAADARDHLRHLH